NIIIIINNVFFFFSSRRRHTRSKRDWSSDVCSSDLSNNDQGEETYPTFSSLLTRGSGFDGEHVLIVTRASEGPHLLKYSDLKNGRTKPIALNTSGVEGGIFPYNTGDIVNGHSYVFNLSGGIFSIYHWANPADVAD